MHYNEGSLIALEDAMALLDQTDVLLSRAERAVRSLSKCIKTAQLASDVEREAITAKAGKASGQVYSRAVPIIESVFSCLRNNTLDLYKAAQTTPSVAQILDEAGSAFGEKSKDVPPDLRVLVRLDERAIYIHMPMLWSQNGRRIRGLNNRKIGPDRVTFFREDIAVGFVNSPNFSTYNFEKYANKIVHFLYVYSDLSSNKIFVADNDNHETKFVQDAATMYLPNGDSPFSCSTFSSALRSVAIPEGTYLTVTTKDTGILSDQEISDFWVKVFEDATEPDTTVP